MREVITEFHSGDLTLEGVLYMPEEGGPRPAVIVCHPHPLYGGSMDNNVVNCLCSALNAESLISFKFNFRGVGRSQGDFGDGAGEQEDVSSAISFITTLSEVDPERVGLIGYSAGAAFALLLTGRSLNIFSMIGLLLLLGIVKKNSIILVDYANAFKAQGFSARESMEKAGPIRLRPILMTATATMMAAVPPALGLGPGAEIRMPMAIAVIGGLVLSTLLSLVVVPAFYVIADRVFKTRRKPLEEIEAVGIKTEAEAPSHLKA